MKVRLDEVCNIYKGKTTITKAVQGEYPLVVTAENRASHNEYQFDCKAVCVPLVSATGHGHASIKRLHYQEGKFALGTILSAVIPKDESILDTRYLYIYLSYFKDSVLVPLMRGSANVSLTIKSLGSAEIELPSIEKQKTIVELVTKIEENKNIIDLMLDEQIKVVSLLKEKILDLAVKGNLVEQDINEEPANILIDKIIAQKENLIASKIIKKELPLHEISNNEIPYELPIGWKWERIGNLITLKGGKRIPKGHKIKTEVTEHIYIRITDMKDGSIRDNDLRYIDKDTYEKIKNYIITSDDLYITIAGTIAQVGIVPDKFNNMNLTENAARIIPYQVNKMWLKYFLESNLIKNCLIEKANQMAQPKLALKRINDTLIPVPPLNEQNRIVEKIEKLMKICNELELRIEKSKKYSKKLMESILKDSFKA